MKKTILSVLVALIASGCSHKTKSTVTTNSVIPRFSIDSGDIVGTASVEVVTGRVPSSPTQEVSLVDFQFSTAEAAKFRQFTKEHLNQKVQIMVGTNVVEEPVIRAEIPGPGMELSFFSADKARAVADSLSKK